ncbi:MAG: MFS transporter [Kangiellaceae bacterium]|nr:MFS transporter [Kangiellaceae bacterium]
MNLLKARATLATVMLVTLLGTAGIALPYPILAPYFMDPTPSTLASFMGLNPKILLGIALATYPLGLLIGSNVIGSLSDRYGRKKVLINSLIGSTLGYVATAIAVQYESFVFFILARIATGFFEGNISIARAITVELHPIIERTRALSLLYSTSYAGWLIGPLAGGYLMDYGVDVTFYIGGGAVLASLILVIVVLEKTPPQKPSNVSLFREIANNHSATLLKNSELRRFISFYFVFTLGINAFYEFYPLWLVENLTFNSKQIGWTTVVITTFMVIVSSTVGDKISRRFGEQKSLLIGNVVFGMTVLSITFLSAPIIYLPFALTGATIAIINVVFPSMLSQHFGHLGQGKVMGLQVSVFCFTNVIIAIVGSFVSIISADMTLWLAAFFIITSGFMFRLPTHQQTP